MTARATLTQAEIARAIRAAQACGKVAILTRSASRRLAVMGACNNS